MTDRRVHRVENDTCASVRSQLSLLLGEDLDAAEARSVRRHLAECPSCRRELGTWRDVRGHLGALEPSPGDLETVLPGGRDGLVRGVLDALAEAPRVSTAVGYDSFETLAADESPEDVQPARSGWTSWQRLSRIAAACVLFVGGVFLGRGPIGSLSGAGSGVDRSVPNVRFVDYEPGTGNPRSWARPERVGGRLSSSSPRAGGRGSDRSSRDAKHVPGGTFVRRYLGTTPVSLGETFEDGEGAWLGWTGLQVMTEEIDPPNGSSRDND